MHRVSTKKNWHGWDSNPRHTALPTMPSGQNTDLATTNPFIAVSNLSLVVGVAT